jgi:predicted RNA-binding Zn-ribbon protein involved in translation (DUF1610 family)
MSLFIFYLITNIFVSIAIGKWSENKGNSFAFGFIISFIFSPIVGLIVVGISKDNTSNLELRSLKSGDSKKCPYCSEVIKIEAIKCRYCGSDLVEDQKVRVAKSMDSTNIVCPNCKISEITSIKNLKNVISISNFSVSYGSFLGVYRFECRKCGEVFKIESQFL